MKKILLFTSGIFLFSQLFSQAPTDDILRFPFSNASLVNEGSTGTTNNLSNNTPITLTPVTDRDSYVNSAVELGVGGGLGTQVAADLKDLTLGFWVNIPSTENTGSTRIIQAYGDAVGSSVGGFQINYDRSSDYLGFNVRAGNGAAYLGEDFGDSINLNDAAWHHIVMRTELVSGNLEIDVFIDGVEKASLSNQLIDMSFFSGGSVNRFVRNGNFAISPTSNYSHGIDDIKLYDRKLTSTEVIALYNENGIEYIAPKQDTLYVNPIATGTNDGSSWVNAYTDAREAFINTTKGDEVWIAKGTYIRNSTDRSTVFGWTADSVKVFGGFSGDGTETSISQRDWDANPTIFSGDIGIVGNNSDNAYTVFVGPIGTINYSLIDGIKITEGNANTGSYPSWSRCGAGIGIDANIKEIMLRNIDVYNNKAGHAAGVWYNQTGNSKITLESVKIYDNYATTSPAFEFRCSGGNLFTTMSNCLVYDNESFSANTSGNDYGSVGFLGVSGGNHNYIAINSTFANNTKTATDNTKGAIRAYKHSGSGSFTMKNCIMNDNAADYSLTNKSYNNGAASWDLYYVTNNILENDVDFSNSGIINNLSSDPLFVDASNGDFQLNSTSPAINAGTQTGVSVSVLDLAGNNRVFGSEIDMGAYEYGASAGPTSVQENKTNTFMVYPNPSTNYITLKGIENEAIVSVSILNVRGQVIFNESTVNRINVSDLKHGIYIVQVETVNHHYTTRFIKN